MARHTYRYKYHAELRSAAPADACLKQRLAWRLRGLAVRLDNGLSLSFTCRTTPALSQHQVLGCLRGGFAHTVGLMKTELNHINTERFMRQHHPALYAHAETSRSP